MFAAKLRAESSAPLAAMQPELLKYGSKSDPETPMNLSLRQSEETG
jgi:hypothetical protein